MTELPRNQDSIPNHDPAQHQDPAQHKTYAPGWYPDPSGAPGLSWWDGARWTGQRHDPSLEVYGATPPLVAGPGTRVNDALLWTIVLLPVLSLLALSQFDMATYLMKTLSTTVPTIDPAYVLLQVLSFAIYVATILLAFFDYRRLSRHGIARPFHWAWTFLSAGVYVIGRSVIVRRRVGGTLTAVWAWVAIVVAGLVVAVAKMSDAMTSYLPAVMDSIPS
ncbi:DUF2510 domain-containing protein [Cryobacterium roopkundense]|uniref:DUF2510 domain-containing protein n=1 Tax=Cryobacterium roopkundense TaxID=1001240 RepID=A0A7W8ZTY3_9MICO|nr:DUF2510 domain-containing protein [Cryobacterium roopkundense]MBB5640018.1 hypothetical protein [Cryobacterium roopkundense]